MSIALRNITDPGHPKSKMMDLEKAAELFWSISNPIRLGALLRLMEREWSVNELATDLNISQSALSQHLSKLRQSDVVRARRNRQTIFYRCCDPLVMHLLAEVGLSR
ncbi:ArsR/SmtB family transcription factor [Rhizobium sp. SL42]|uniref:ArsR/SmtB family transcription factor n=1 Tax=Rhizobium sp. SL42 TaxID=2806346 RepID=UPI001F00E401|nr:metalloregulator ArsR/SmtB family transcription factor [Rhizobium sp. SL42]UJW77771.1 winged helix-turn-helix transcriptional regulator [Rhizobium sp. SL42]